MADRDYEKPVPEALKDVELPDSGKESIPADSAVSPWKKQFGRHSHEAFSAWHHALYINEIAEAGKGIYRIPMITNVMVGEQSYEEPGLCYNAGAAVGRVLDIWKAGSAGPGSGWGRIFIIRTAENMSGSVRPMRERIIRCLFRNPLSGGKPMP